MAGLEVVGERLNGATAQGGGWVVTHFENI